MILLYVMIVYRRLYALKTSLISLSLYDRRKYFKDIFRIFIPFERRECFKDIFGLSLPFDHHKCSKDISRIYIFVL